jgi:hypothetical protein
VGWPKSERGTRKDFILVGLRLLFRVPRAEFPLRQLAGHRQGRQIIDPPVGLGGSQEGPLGDRERGRGGMVNQVIGEVPMQT